MSGSTLRILIVAASVLLAGAGAAGAQKAEKAPKPQKPKAADNYDELFERYLKEAEATAKASPDASFAWMSVLATDRRARAINDLITIKVVENITGSGTADAALTKDGDASIALRNLFGVEKALPSSIDPASLAAIKTSTDFKGTGTTTRAGELTGRLTARVSSVLPSGDLVVEGVREIEINGDRQMIVLTGVVRVADIDPANTVLSTSIGQLRIRYFGRGLMQDNLQPGWLIRMLNKIF